MNSWNKHKHIALGFLALTLGISLTGCAEDSALTNDGAQRLCVTPKIQDAQLSRAASTDTDASLNEDKLSSLNIKMYGEYDECKVDKTFTDSPQSGKAEVIAQNNWKVDCDLQEGKTYAVKAVANYTGTDGTQTDDDIWKPCNATSNNCGKTFLMSSTQDYKVTEEPTQNIPVTLTRAAAKIMMTVSVNVSGYTVGQPKWQLRNYNAKTTVFDSETTEADIKEGNNNDWTEATKSSDGTTYALTTYSYAMTWADDDAAPAIYLQIPLTDADKNTEINYYKIPVRNPKASGDNAKSLARNTLYTINATINSKGGSSDVDYIDAGKVVYDILPWSEGGTTNIDANTSYLMVYPTTLIMKNISSDNTSISYKSSDELEVSIKEMYYYNKYGNKITINDTEYSEKDGKNDVHLYPKVSLSTGETGKYEGKVSIESAIPINLTAKYFVFTVKIKDSNKSVDVLVKQYPIKYVQNIAGWYSTKDKKNWIDWKNDQTVHPAVGSSWGQNYGKTSSDKWFQAKVYTTKGNNTGIWEYTDQPVKSGFQAKTVDNMESSQSNNHMYVIQITKSDGTYKIARPKFNDLDLKSEDHCVSPAFMLGSQLGTVSPFGNFEDAAQHCKDYVEVSIEGKRYDDWRLPTQEEINSIVEFQNDTKAANTMDRVLAGYYYWSANGQVSEKVPGSTKDNRPGAVRCIRDLSPEEVTELENKQ